MKTNILMRNLLLPNFGIPASIWRQRLNTRTYTRGAQKLFHRVDWDRAVGLVVVVDPFDPSSLLYLPQAGYLDLIKTALANRSPLVVVHGLNDEVPSVSTEPDGNRKTDSGASVEFRIFKVNGKEVHRVPLTPSQNSPRKSRVLQTPTTALGVEVPITGGSREGVPPERAKTPSGSTGLQPDVQLEQKEGEPLATEQSAQEPKQPRHFVEVEAGELKELYVPPGYVPWPGVPTPDYDTVTKGAQSPQEATELYLSAKKEYENKRLEAMERRYPNYGKQLNHILSELGIYGRRTIRSVTASLDRNMPRTKLRNWVTFLPWELRLPVDASLKWPSVVATPWRRPFSDAKAEAMLLHLYAWAGSTLLARSARSLQWTFTIIKEYLRLWEHNGLKSANAAFKEASRILTKFLAETPASKSEPGPLSIGIEKGLPTILPRGLRRYIRDGHVIAIRLAFFALSVSDLLKYEAPPKLSTISAPYNGREFSYPEFDKEICQGVEDLELLGKSRVSLPVWKKFHTSVKAGPSAKAMISAPLDAVALEASESWEPFLRLSELTKGADKLVSATSWLAWVTRAVARPFWLGRLGKFPVGKLSQVVEPRGKVRVVAIPGYQIQSLLKPLHDRLYDFLRSLETDHTFDQERGVKRCMAAQQLVMNSYDLSAATDRFPLWFEKVALGHLFRHSRGAEDYAQAWSDLLESLEFQYRLTRQGRLHSLKYGSGQPMGTYSSWASFAISHHVVVMMSARRAGFTDFRDYDLLGDDIVLRGDSPEHQVVFSHYLALMESLGVSINPIKGISSTNGTFEFAKRLVRKDEVLSSIKWKELAAVHSWKRVCSLANSLGRRGLPLPHLRVLLEVGFQLIFKMPFGEDLTDPRRVPLASFKSLRDPLVMLTSPVGPYKTTLVGWLSLRGIHSVDFHPNLGHFVNNISRVVMGHEIGYPIAVGLRQVRKELINRVIEAHGTALPTLKALFKTFMSKRDSSERGETAAVSKSLWKFSDPTHITDSLRGYRPDNETGLSGLMASLGIGAYRNKKGNLAFSWVWVMAGLEKPGQSPGSLASRHMFVGLLKTLVSQSPARLVNLRLLVDLLGANSVRDDPTVDPDYSWTFGLGSAGYSREESSNLLERVTAVTDSIVPDRYKNPAHVLQECRECITDYMKFSVADILPSSLPAHLDMMEELEEVQASFSVSAHRSLRNDTTYETGLIFTLPEGTNQSEAPMYVLEHTNAIRACAQSPDLIPRPGVAERTPRRLTDSSLNPLVYVPADGFEKRFWRPLGVTGFTGHMLMHMHPEQFRALLCQGDLPRLVSKGFAEQSPEEYRSVLCE